MTDQPHHRQHTAHHEWVRAAIRDHLGLTDDGGAVILSGDGLDKLAEVARRETLNWAVQAAKAGLVEHHCNETCDHDSTGPTELGG